MRTARCYHGARACTIGKMRLSAVLACVAVCGCVARAPTPRTFGASACRTGPVLLWLDFEGAGVVNAPVDDSAAMPVQSSLAPSSAVIPPFDSTTIAPKVARADAIASIVDRVRTLFAPFAVDIVTARPAAPPYTRVLVGGTAAALGVTSVEAGLARVDCGNLTDGDVAYDVAAAQTPDYGGVVGSANTAAHEAGHAFGLEHVDDPRDVMYAAASPMLMLPDLFALAFGAGGNFSSYGSNGRQCTTTDPVDEPAMLDCNVGARAPGGDVTPPTVSWPAPTSDVPLAYTVTAQASDDVGVVRVEIYKNLELVAALTAPPYITTVTAAPGERFYVTVEAIDAAANRTAVTHPLTAAMPMTGPADAGAPPVDAAAPPPMPSGHGGCAFAAAASAPSLPWLLIVAALLLTASRRSSGSG